MLALLGCASVARAAESAEDAYQAARKGYYTLKADESRRKFRHNWQKVAGRFDSVAQKFPKSERAPDALFTAAQLFEDLSQISRLQEDLDAAVTDYRKLLDAYPKHRLCDDAALALARIQLDRIDDPDKARQTLTDALAKYPKADRSKEMRALLATLPAPEVSPVVAAIAKVKDAPPPPAPPPAVAQIQMPTPAAPPAAAAAPIAVKERLKDAAKPGSELTLAEQLGLKVRRVVIDAGHGGHDTGAVGPGGTKEKEVALAIANRVGALLEEAGLTVIRTRPSDTFVRLEDRAKIANEAKGDLFISIHCNSSPTPVYRGIETYTLNTSSDRYSIRLAARENSSSEKGISDLQFILADLATKANTDESQRLATRVQHSVVEGLKAKYKDIHDLKTKEALFYVLLGTRMPAILVETSFLSNPEEEKRLATKAYQEDVARSIAQGVQGFLDQREQVAKVP